jgi:hypothetical protein
MHKRSLLFTLFSLVILMPACLLSTGYQKKGGSYIYATSDEGQGYVEHPITDIDARSFQILSKHGYAKDDRHVYYHEMTVEGADTHSFTSISDLYGKDTAHVYYDGKLIPGADPASFAPFNIQWGKDAQDVYFQNRPLEACDPATFVLLKESWQSDSQCVYREGTKLPEADPSTFVVLNFWFGKDKNHVYSNSPKIMEGADPATFKISDGICAVCAEDKNRCYRYDEPVACEPSK